MQPGAAAWSVSRSMMLKQKQKQQQNLYVSRVLRWLLWLVFSAWLVFPLCTEVFCVLRRAILLVSRCPCCVLIVLCYVCCVLRCVLCVSCFLACDHSGVEECSLELQHGTEAWSFSRSMKLKQEQTQKQFLGPD